MDKGGNMVGFILGLAKGLLLIALGIIMMVTAYKMKRQYK